MINMQNVMFQPKQLIQSKEEPGSFADRQYNPANHLLRLLLLLLDFIAFTGSNTTCLVHVSSTPEAVARGQLSWPSYMTLCWLLCVCKCIDLLRSSIAVSLSQWIISKLHGCISLSKGRFRGRGVSSLAMLMACGSISLPRKSGAGLNDQQLHISSMALIAGIQANPSLTLVALLTQLLGEEIPLSQEGNFAQQQAS